MNHYYQYVRVFAALLLCALLQYCTRDIPVPVPVGKNTAPASILANKSAGDAAKKQLVKQLKVIRVAAQKDSKRPANPTTASRIAVCYDYFLVYYTNGVETGRDFWYTDCSGDGGSSGSGGGSTGGDGSGGGGGGGGTGGGDGSTPQCRACGYVPPTPEPSPTSVIVQTSVQNDPKAECVLSKLQNNAQFNELLKNFRNTTQYNVSFSMATNLGSTGTCKWDYGTATANITIDKDAFDLQHAIWGATTLFHETYHAQLQQYAIATFGTQVIGNWPRPINDMTLQELIGCIDATASANAQWTNATHNYMAYNNSIMAEGLRSFIQANYPQTYAQIGSDITKYNYLSLMGLEGTTRFRDEIINQGKNNDYLQAINDFITSELPNCL